MWNLWLQKKGRTPNFFPSSFIAVGSDIRDRLKIRILDKHPGSATHVVGGGAIVQMFSDQDNVCLLLLSGNYCVVFYLYLNNFLSSFVWSIFVFKKIFECLHLQGTAIVIPILFRLLCERPRRLLVPIRWQRTCVRSPWKSARMITTRQLRVETIRYNNAAVSRGDNLVQ